MNNMPSKNFTSNYCRAYLGSFLAAADLPALCINIDRSETTRVLLQPDISRDMKNTLKTS